MNNKRKNKRFDCLVPVDGKKDSTFDGIRTVDYSKSGIGFISKNEIPVNQEIALEIDLDEMGDPAFVIGRVQWVRPVPESGCYRIGMEFKEVLRGSKSRLDQHFMGKKLRN